MVSKGWVKKLAGKRGGMIKIKELKKKEVVDNSVGRLEGGA